MNEDMFQRILIPITTVITEQHLNDLVMDAVCHPELLPKIFQLRSCPGILTLIHNFNFRDVIETQTFAVPFYERPIDFYEVVVGVKKRTFQRYDQYEKEKIEAYKLLWAFKKDNETWSEQELKLIDSFSIPIQDTEFKILL